MACKNVGINNKKVEMTNLRQSSTYAYQKLIKLYFIVENIKISFINLKLNEKTDIIFSSDIRVVT